MKIVFFDGVCNLCNAYVDWLIGRDRKGGLKFAPLQGKTAREQLGLTEAEARSPMSLIYWRNGERYEGSTAVIHILSDLGGGFAGFRALLVIPRFLREPLYRVLAASRYRLFGRRDTCRLPTAAEKERFLP